MTWEGISGAAAVFAFVGVMAVLALTGTHMIVYNDAGLRRAAGYAIIAAFALAVFLLVAWTLSHE